MQASDVGSDVEAAIDSRTTPEQKHFAEFAARISWDPEQVRRACCHSPSVTRQCLPSVPQDFTGAQQQWLDDTVGIVSVVFLSLSQTPFASQQ